MRLTSSAVNFAARFGFITQDLFFKYFCGNLKSQKYYYWTRLLSNGHFFESKSNQNIYFLSTRGRRLAQFNPAPARSVYLIPHDLLVAKTLLEIEATSLVSDSWTESELLASASNTYSVLGVDRIEKLPDLVFDLKTKSKILRCAIEIENSRKVKERYDRMSLNYLAMKHINLVIFGCDTPLIANSIKQSFSGEIFLKNQKIPIVFQNKEFEIEGFEVEATLLNRKMPLRKMLIAALELDEFSWPKMPETNHNEFRKIPEKQEYDNSEKPKKNQDFKSARPSTGPLASFRDHPLPTNTLREGGHETGAGVGRGPEKIRDRE